MNRSRVPPNAWTIYRNAIEVYDDRETNHLKLSLSTVQKYIKKFGEANFHPNWYCNTTELPTAYSRLNELNQRYCTVTGGNGTKVIVVIGDSHSTTYVPPQYYKWPNERKSILPILREFNYPIDILIVGQCYDNSDPPLDSRNITQDSIYREMITFYVELSKIAREIVLIPGVQFDSILHRNLVLNENMKMFRLPYNYIARQKPNTRRRLAAVKCPKCVVVKWEDLWCKKREGYCDAVDQHHRLPFFWDQHHPSLYGSMFVGSYLRRIYDNQMMKQSNVSL
ncbi:hypothetical protein M3Y94_00069600 [Aphelenchoides besseyi]|nr:hypothetical protein M3Y94_00069600 [Aphelenchoides besseyi]